MSYFLTLPNSIRKLSLFSALLFSAAASYAQEPTNLTLAEQGAAQVAPRVESRAGRTYVAYIRVRQLGNGDIMFTSRGAGEASFANAVAVTNTGKINASLQRGPEFVVTPDGTIHMVWMESRIGTNPDIYYSRGTENGTKWSAPVDISIDQQRATQDFPSIAADSNGNIYVAWIDNRDLIDGKLENDQIYMTRSLDGGVTWDVPKRASVNPGDVGGSCECCRTSIAASRDGEVYITYRTNMENSRDIFVARSLNRGETFEESVRVQTTPWMIMACPATGPMTALDIRGNLHIVYRSAAKADRAVIYYNLLPHNASKTFTEMALSNVNGSSANYADIAVTDSGALSVVYQESGRIYELTSGWGGVSWTPAVVLDSSESEQAYPIVGFNDQTRKLWTLWQDDRRDKNDILALEREFSPYIALPRVMSFDRKFEADSIRLSWAPVRPMTWYLLRFADTTIVTYENSLTIPRSYNEKGSILLTPITAIGRGDNYSFGPLSVTSPEHSASIELSKHPVFAGEQVALNLVDNRDLTWDVYDLQGRNHGTVTSSPSRDHHEMQIPLLAPGVFYLHCGSLSKEIKLVILAR